MMKRIVFLAALVMAVGTVGCEREYISCDDPRFPAGLEPSSPLAFWKQRSQFKALQELADGERKAELQTAQTP